MYGLRASKRRFNLFYLEESELYTEDFSGYCIYKNIHSKEDHKEKGKFHICTKSIIFESDSHDISLMKFNYKNMIKIPQLSDSFNEKRKSIIEQNPQTSNKEGVFIQLSLNKLIEIQTNGPPSPYIIYDFEKEPFYFIQIIPIYQDVYNIYEWISKLYYVVKQSQNILYKKLIMDRNNKSKFNMSHTESVSEKPLLNSQMFVRQILPLQSVYGILYITDNNIYFQPMHSISTKPVKIIPIDEISRLYKRRFELRHIALELMLNNKNKSYYFACEDQQKRNQVYNALLGKVPISCISELSLDKVTLMWQNKKISNYEYLMNLNHAGNRSFADLSQYPVFPWILKNYDSEEIDLNDPHNYRDLRKTVGEFNLQRFKDFKDRYNEMPPPKFLYGTHYSTPGYVIGYLVRNKPEYMLKLQSGKFDKPDRLFKSIKGDWRNVMQNPTSLKELIPQFFGEDDSFLINYKELNFGIRQNGKKVDHVKLPKWAKNDAKLFLKIQKEALEHDIVSAQLHHWIDLIFGYKQRGPHAIEANNVFHPLTYEGYVDLDQISDPIERQAQRCQINEFGQCPKQLFKIAHPPRNSNQLQEDILKYDMSIKSDNFYEQQNLTYSEIINNSKYLWDISDRNLIVQNIQKVHKKHVTQIIKLVNKPNQIISIGEDGFLKVCDLQSKQVIKSFKICDLNLSSFVVLKEDEIFAIGCWDNKLYIFNLNYGSKIKIIKAHNESISSIGYLKSKCVLLTASWDCTVKSFDCEDGIINETSEDLFWDHDSQITNLAINQQEIYVAVGDVDGNVIILDFKNKNKIASYNINDQQIIKIIFSRGHIFVAGDRTVKHYELNKISHFQLEKQNGQITDIEIDEKHLILITNRGHLGIYDLLSEKKIGFYFNNYSIENEEEFPSDDQQFSTLTTQKDENQNVTAYIGSLNGSINIISKI
ncbi:neutral sphingomyelinase activation associated factor, putative [Ichthyophthirius multifiliis]|uniref:Neutral sphingomyelinase activation associated factor, putative n=1 Tax=Ichthyophthirius multifiliis TaxID=5932 RepID=G0QMH6_ICHMU|nr:neutral sphingomyelinase activation associated factor, putative [Ichthyophthirius multifiliis]EGR33579.1 neutral sphingomyelinase activation associated factor, putative [Ichthyophthirius multifiliis]|eukprot:XP_004037565.1 neutral sphingomyelinase activation associated factor, putative [Ichthyophthirius multifiliis]